MILMLIDPAVNKLLTCANLFLALYTSQLQWLALLLSKSLKGGGFQWFSTVGVNAIKPCEQTWL